MEPFIRKICETIARQNHTTPEQVYVEISGAIHSAYSSPQPDDVRKAQALVPHKGDIPTPEEMLVYLAKTIQGQMKDANPI